MKGGVVRLRVVARLARVSSWSSTTPIRTTSRRRRRAGSARPKPPIVIDRYHFKRDRDGYLTRLYPHLALFDVAAQKLEPLTSGQVDDEEPAWSPDGTRIAFLSKRAHPDPDRTVNTDLFVVEAQRRRDAAPADDDAADRGRPAGLEPRRPAHRRAGARRGHASTPTTWRSSRWCRPRAARRSSSPPALDRAVVRRRLDRRRQGPRLRASRTTAPSWIGRVPAAGGAVERLTTRPAGGELAQPRPRRRRWRCSSRRPPSRPRSARWRRARCAGSADAERRADGRAPPRHHRGLRLRPAQDGTVVHGLMVKPPDYVAGRRYPTLLHIHGGPNGQDDYSFGFERELFAANGYVVLEINYRGSERSRRGVPEGDLRGLGRQGGRRPAGRRGRGDPRSASPIRSGSGSAAGATAASSPTT